LRKHFPLFLFDVVMTYSPSTMTLAANFWSAGLRRLDLRDQVLCRRVFDLGLVQQIVVALAARSSG